MELKSTLLSGTLPGDFLMKGRRSKVLPPPALMRGNSKIFSELLALGLLACGLLGIIGCGNGTSTTPTKPIEVSISPLAATLEVGATQQFTAAVSGAANTAVTWKVSGVTGGNPTVGTIDANGLYTAPATVPGNGSVAVTAVSQADSTKYASANVNIAAPAISVVVSPAAPSLQTGATQQFTAAVTGTANTAVTWQVAGVAGGNSTVGTIDASGLYTAPASVPTPATVTVTAISSADATVTGSATVTITAPAGISVTVSPSAPSVATGATQQFTATVTGTSNTVVTWEAGGVAGGNSTFGTIDATGLYAAPASVPTPATVTITAISSADPSKTGTATATVTAGGDNNALLSGQYAFLFNGFDGSTNFETAVPFEIGGTFTADGSGNITAGNEDVNAASGVSTSVPFTGNYSIGVDRRGTLTTTSSLGTTTYNISVVTSGNNGTFIEFDDTTGSGSRGSGIFKKQDTSVFSLAAFNGDFAFNLSGDLSGHWAALAGRFTSSSIGVLSSGLVDGSTQGSNLESLALTGNLFAIDTNGRGTATFNITGLPAPISGTFTFTTYVVSASEAFIVETDARSASLPALTGVIRKQSGPFSSAAFNAGVIVNVAGLDVTDGGNTVVVGQLAGDGAGNFTGTLDAQNGTTTVPDVVVAGTYSIAANGRGVLTFVTNPGGLPPVVMYMAGSNQAFLLSGTAASPSGEPVTGTAEPQSAGPFDLASISGDFTGGNTVPTGGDTFNAVAALNVDGAGNMNGTADVSDHNGLNPGQALSGVYSFANAAIGRGTITSVALGGTVPIYVISPTKFVFLVPGGPGNDRAVAIVLEK